MPVDTLLWALAIVLMAVGFAGIVLPALPGVPVMFAGMLVGAWIDDFTRIGALPLVVLGVLTALTIAIDVAAGAIGARRVGASRQAIAGAAIGTVLGLFLGIVGLLIGPFVGAMIGELIARRGALGQSLRVGAASWVAFALGSALKVAIAFAMVAVFVAALLLN